MKRFILTKNSKGGRSNYNGHLTCLGVFNTSEEAYDYLDTYYPDFGCKALYSSGVTTLFHDKKKSKQVINLIEIELK